MLKKLGTFIKISKKFSTKFIWVLAYLNLLDFTKEHTLRTLDGTTISLSDKDSFGIVNEIFCEEVYNKYRKIKNTGKVIDIGANIGVFSLFAASSGKDVKVYAFEALPANIAILEKNIKQNNLEKRILATNVAVASDDRGRVLHLGEAGGHHTTLPEQSPAFIPAQKVVNVPSLTLGQIFEKNMIDKCDFLKVDCEGAEYEILLSTENTLLQKIEYIAMEYHNGFKELMLKLEGAGFSVINEPQTERAGMLYAEKI